MLKKTKRKGFSFLRSYFDVLNELETDKDRLDFLMAVINKQFLDEDPKDMRFIPKLCYESQRHQIESSVKGYKSKSKDPMQGAAQGATQGGCQGSSAQEEEKEKEKEKEKGKGKVQDVKVFSFKKSLLALGIENQLVLDFLKNRKLKRLANTETAFKNLLVELKKPKIPLNDLMKEIVSNGWGSFKNSWLENQKNNSVNSAKPKKETAYEVLQRLKNGG